MTITSSRRVKKLPPPPRQSKRHYDGSIYHYHHHIAPNNDMGLEPLVCLSTLSILFFCSAESAPFYLTSILAVIIATLYMFFSPANEGCISTCMKMAQTMLSLGQPEVWSFFQLYLLTNFFLECAKTCTKMGQMTVTPRGVFSFSFFSIILLYYT